MELLMDVAGFTLGEANNARKIVGKKQMNKIPELRTQVYGGFEDRRVADYFWENAIAPQLGYAFSLNHSLPYSFVGMQSIYFVINFNPIYWNTACLIVNSGATDEEAGGSTDYGKIAKAIGDIMSVGIQVSLANINKSDFGFAPDVENNRILFGLKGMLNVGDDVIAATIANRPYASPRDYLNKVHPGKQAMISLIKGGAFDASYLSVDHDNIMIDTVKLAEDGSGDIIVRLYESKKAAVSTKLHAAFTKNFKAYDCDMLENIRGEFPVADGSIDLSFRAFEIKPVRLSANA